MIQTCILDGAAIRDKETLHTLLAEGLNFPCWYGRNLDALYDCLTDVQEETEVVLLNMKLLEESLGHYMVSLMGVLQKASEENANVRVNIR